MTQDKLTQRLESIKKFTEGHFSCIEDVTLLLALVEEYQKALESIALDQYDSSDMRQFHSRAKSALARGEELAGGE